MKKALPIALMIMLTFGAVDGQVTKSISLTNAGTLDELLTTEEKVSITHLTVSGNMNAVDFSVIRQMTALSYIDLSSASILGDSIPDNAFEYMYYLDSIDLPSSIVHIGNSAFRDNDLKKIELPESLESIGENAFTWSYQLDSIFLPSHVISIGTAAFSHCKALKTFVFPASLKSLGQYPFIRCTALEKIILDPSNPYMTVENGALLTADKTKLIYFPAKYPVSEYTVPSTVDTIGDYAFFSNSLLYTINIPESVNFIGSSSFDEADSLKAIDVNGSNSAYCSQDGILYNKNKSILMKSPPNKQGGCILPSEVKTISMNAFANSKLNPIILPSGLKEIWQTAFVGCTNLTSLEIPDSVYLGYSPFSGCTRLKSIELPRMDRVSASMFSYCKSLRSVVLPPMVTAIDDYAFYNCDSLESVSIPGFVSTISQYAFDGCPRLTSITNFCEIPVALSEQGTYFSSDIFQNCTLYVPFGSKAAYLAAPVWQNFNIEEFSCSLAVSTTELQIAHESGSIAKFSITSNTTWKIESDQDWLMIDRTMGINNDSIILKANANMDNTSRSAVITVIGSGTDPFTVAVTQEAGVLVITKFYDEEMITMHFNPVTSNIVIRNASNLSAQVYDMRGGLVLVRQIASDNDCLDVSGLTGGVYIIKVEGKVLKFVK